MFEKSSHEKPRVFIGSSSRPAALDVAREIQTQLHPDIVAKVWDKEEWLGKATLERLTEILEEYDFGVFILRPDDVTQVKDQLWQTSRDNVIFELGLFIGKHGRDRTFIFFQAGENLRTPSDLLGINFALYQAGSSVDIEIACNKIRDRVLRSWKEENERSQQRSSNIDPLTSEAGILCRILNAASYPQYRAIESELLGPIKVVGDKSFAHIDHVIDIAEELFSHYMFPHLRIGQTDARHMRVYFAYYLGDGAPIKPELDPTYCVGKDTEGEDFKGTFVIGISNSDRFVETNWMSGRPLMGYSETGKSLSNAAETFRHAEEHLIPDTDRPAQSQNHLNFKLENEKTVYSVPVLFSERSWTQRESCAPIGILTISGSHPGMITQAIVRRAEQLATLLGFIFYLHAKQNPDEPLVNEEIGISRIPIGFERGSDVGFIRRAVSLRREIAQHFEEYFIEQGIHNLKNQDLVYRHMLK